MRSQPAFFAGQDFGAIELAPHGIGVFGIAELVGLLGKALEEQPGSGAGGVVEGGEAVFLVLLDGNPGGFAGQAVVLGNCSCSCASAGSSRWRASGPAGGCGERGHAGGCGGDDRDAVRERLAASLAVISSGGSWAGPSSTSQLAGGRLALLGPPAQSRDRARGWAGRRSGPRPWGQSGRPRHRGCGRRRFR